jgi:hypothetical protein
VWTVVCLAAIGVALWLLEVRDWRCYALAAAFPFTRSSIALGTVAPLLVLSFAAAWCWRARVVEPALAVGSGIALKFLSWPLVVWLAVTRRRRASAASVAAAVLLTLIPWAAIGFAGLGGYAGLLRHVSRDEASSSYSVVALAVRAHLPESVGFALSLVVALALIGAAVWVWRSGRATLRDREAAAFTLALAAALAASPIVWVHYFMLLLVPLALARPRLSLLWFVPFAYFPLGESAWPAGDAGKLALATVVTLLILGAAVMRVLRPEHRAVAAEARPPRERLAVR